MNPRIYTSPLYIITLALLLIMRFSSKMSFKLQDSNIPTSSNARLVKITRNGSSNRSLRRSQRVGKNGRDPVEVFCRLRPMGDPFEKSCVEIISEDIIQLCPPATASLSRGANRTVTQHTFKKVYSPECGQKELFNQIALPLVNDLLHGKNGLLFAYGITNSGKTHTMNGTSEDNGILPRTLDVVFNSIGDLLAKPFVFRQDKSNWFSVHTEADARVHQESLKKSKSKKKSKNKPHEEPAEDSSSPVSSRITDESLVQGIVEDNSYAVFISYFEIYNNYVYDLLEDPSDASQSLLMLRAHRGPQAKTMREDSRHNLYVGGGTEVEVRTANEAYALLGRGQKLRRNSQTQMNRASSRSHAIFNIRLVQVPLDSSGEEVLQEKSKVSVSQLSLVDLAGSERTSRTKSAGAQLREAGNINASLMVLRNCIETLRDNQLNAANKLVPYRDSKLTHLFKNFFDGEGKVRMIICLNPRTQDYEEITYVMKFSELTQSVCIDRAEGPKHDTSLSVGRRRANILYKTALKQLEEESRMKEEQEEALAALDLVIGREAGKHPFAAALPPLGLDIDRYLMRELSIQEFVQALKDRSQVRIRLREEIARKQSVFREMLVAMEEEREELKISNSKHLTKISNQEHEIELLQERVNKLQKRNDQLQKTADTYFQAKKDLEAGLEAAEVRVAEEKQRRERIKSMIQGILCHEKAKWESKMRMKMTRSEEELLFVLREKQGVIDELKKLVENERGLNRPASFYSITSPTFQPNGIGEFPRNPINPPINTDSSNASKPTKIPFPTKLRKKVVQSPPSHVTNAAVFDHYIIPNQDTPTADGITHLYKGGTTCTIKGVETASHYVEVRNGERGMPKISAKPSHIPKLSEKLKPSSIPVSTSFSRTGRSAYSQPHT